MAANECNLLPSSMNGFINGERMLINGNGYGRSKFTIIGGLAIVGGSTFNMQNEDPNISNNCD